jgi:hypothetical protein
MSLQIIGVLTLATSNSIIDIASTVEGNTKYLAMILTPITLV